MNITVPWSAVTGQSGIPADVAEGWRLQQPEPGVLVWHTPAGRTYVTRPTRYPA